IAERLGDQAGMASSYHELGNLSYLRADYDEAERRYTQSLTIFERLGKQARMARSYHPRGMPPPAPGGYPATAPRPTQSLTISGRLGDQAKIALGLSQLGLLRVVQDRTIEAVPLHVQALAIRLTIGIPEVVRNIQALREIKDAIGLPAFTRAIESLLDKE